MSYAGQVLHLPQLIHDLANIGPTPNRATQTGRRVIRNHCNDCRIARRVRSLTYNAAPNFNPRRGSVQVAFNED